MSAERTESNQLTQQLEEFAKEEPIVDRLNSLPLGGIVSYSELCKLLGEKEVFANSRKAQRTRWDKYMVLETVGRKLMIKQVYSPKDYKVESSFHADETHIMNSNLLLQNYLLERLTLGCTEDTTIEGIYSVILFKKELAQLCGYIPAKFYDFRNLLAKGDAEIAIRPVLQCYFASCISETFSDMARKLMASLVKKKLIVVREVYVGIEGFSKWDLSDEQVVLYNSVLIDYANQYNKGKLIRINTANKVFKSMLRASGLPFINIYKGYKIFFKESVIRDSLERELQQQLVNSNNGHFKSKVSTKIVKHCADVTDDYNKRVAKGRTNAEIDADNKDFNLNALYGLDKANEIDWLLEEYLTYGVLKEEEEL